MRIFAKKWVVALAILIPNAVVAIVRYHENYIFALGAAAGAATVVFLFYIVCRTLLQKTRLKRDLVIPLALLSAYAIYYLYTSLDLF